MTKSQNTRTETTFVSDFELDRYLGTWYEIARYDHTFERGLQGVTAEYTLRKNGKLNVVNKGFKKSPQGKESVAKGKAKFAGLATDGHLKVSFFLFFYADYYIMELDADYQWAIIGSSSEDYLWILARKPYLTNDMYQELLQRIQQRGYNTDKLIKVEHDIDRYVEFPVF